MAYLRSITARVKLFYQQQHRLTPLFSHTHRHDTDGEEFPAKSVSRNFEIRSCIQNRFLGTESNLSNFQRSSNFVGCGLVFGRSFSSPSVGEGVADGVEYYSDAVEAEAAKVTPDVAAANSAGPVAAVQYTIDYVHGCTGFNWWASISVATVLVRCLQIPFPIKEMKIISKVATEAELVAYRRSLTAQAKLFYQQQLHQIHRDREEFHTKPVSRHPEFSSFSQHHFCWTGNNFSNFHGSRNTFKDRIFAMPSSCGLVFSRNYSSTGDGEGGAILNDVVGEMAVEVAPVVNEVVVAAADSAFPVAAAQYLIDYVHCFTGFNWWSSIAVTAILVSALQIPLAINELKIRPIRNLQLTEIKQGLKDKSMSHTEGWEKINAILKEYVATPFRAFVTSAVLFNFSLAIWNMTEKVPSLKEGGILWFTDLTTPDSTYILPLLTALTFRIAIECLTPEEHERNPNRRILKDVLSAFMMPNAAGLPKSVVCFWITYNLSLAAYEYTLRMPEVKKFLGLPILPPPPPPSSNPQSKNRKNF